MLEKILNYARRKPHVYTQDEYQNLHYSHGHMVSFITEKTPQKGDKLKYHEKDKEEYEICFTLKRIHRIRNSNRYFCEVNIDSINETETTLQQ